MESDCLELRKTVLWFANPVIPRSLLRVCLHVVCALGSPEVSPHVNRINLQGQRGLPRRTLRGAVAREAGDTCRPGLVSPRQVLPSGCL